MIRRIKIEGYKSFAEAEVGLEPFSCIFGPNASGKSNLADLLGFLARSARADSLREAFRDHRGQPFEAFHSPGGFGGAGHDSLMAGQADLKFLVEVDIELSPSLMERANDELKDREEIEAKKGSYTRVAERFLRYTLVVGLPLHGGEPYVADERLVATNRNGEPKKTRSPFIERKPGSHYVVHLEKQNHPRYFPPDRSRTLLSEISDLVNHPHLVTARREITSWRIYQVTSRLTGREVGMYGAPDPGRSGEDLVPFLHGLKSKRPDEFERLNRLFSEVVPGSAGFDVTEARPGILDLHVVDSGGAEFPLRLVSEGTMRLLCLLAVSAAPERPALVMYEDPEASVHPQRLRQVVDLLRSLSRDSGVQVVISTHSAPLLDLVRAEDAVILCSRKPGRGSTFSLFPPGSLLRQSYLDLALDEIASRAQPVVPCESVEGDETPSDVDNEPSDA